jgi:hypothetical protein
MLPAITMKNCFSFPNKSCLRAAFIAAIAAFPALDMQAQNGPAIQWDRTIGGSSYDYLMEVKQTSDGGFILGGYSESAISLDKSQPSRGLDDYWVVKVDASGNKTWDKTFGGNDHDYLKSVVQTSDGGYLIGGYTESGLNGDKTQASKGLIDYWVVKLDATGNKIWDRTIGSYNNDWLYSLVQTPDGGYILGGESMSNVLGDKTQATKGLTDYWLVKLDAGGNKLWDKVFGGSGEDRLKKIIRTADGGFILGGTSASGISGDKTQASKGVDDYWVVKLDSAGNKIWDKTFGGSNFDEMYNLIQTLDGGYILGGYSESGISGDKSQPSRGDDDFWVVRLDASGNKLWDKTFGGSGEDWLFGLDQTTDGNYIVGGYSHSGISGDKTQASRGGNDYWVIKLNASGNKLWDKTMGGSYHDGLGSIVKTPDGGMLIAGLSESGISPDKSQASKGAHDYWIVKLGPDILGIDEANASSTLSIFPNPGKGTFNLQLSNLTAPIAEVTVSDLLGRVVLQKKISVTDPHISEELTLPNAKGLYLLKVKTGQQLFTRKIVVE